MSHLSHISLKTIFVLCCIHSWCILLVIGGCRRTNPGWAASDHMKQHLTAPLISFVSGPNNFHAAWNESLVSVYDQCYDEVQIWVQKRDSSSKTTLEPQMICQEEYKKKKDSENANSSFSNCSFDGKSLFCGRQNVGVKQTLPPEFVVEFSISLINKNHRKGTQTIQAPSILTIDPSSFSKENPELHKTICDSKLNTAHNEKEDPILLVGTKSHSESCQALVPSWKQSSAVEENKTDFAPNITYPSGSRGYSKTIFSFASESVLDHAKCVQTFHLKYWEQKRNGRRQSSYITETFTQGDNGIASIRLDTRKCQSYKYKLKADKSDPEYSISTNGYFESKCRTPSNGLTSTRSKSTTTRSTSTTTVAKRTTRITTTPTTTTTSPPTTTKNIRWRCDGNVCKDVGASTTTVATAKLTSSTQPITTMTSTSVDTTASTTVSETDLSKVTDTASGIPIVFTTSLNNFESIETSTLSATKEHSEPEDSDVNVKSTTMQTQSNFEVKGKKKYSENNIEPQQNTTVYIETISNESQIPKNVKYNTTEVESSLSDEIAMVLEEKTGWVCNGTKCTDLGPIYDRQKASDDNFLCKIAFDTHSDASCILYDDKYCHTDNGLKEMASGESETDIQKSFGVESVSVRKGCQLVIDTGKQFNGTNRTYKAEDETLHITFRETRKEAIFHERVNSANCSCMEDLFSENCLDNQGKRCFGCLARGGGCDNLSRDKCSRAFRFGAKWCPGYDPDSKKDELKEQPRAINFTITNRKDVGRKNKGLDLNKQSTSASRLIPSNDPFYSDNSKANVSMYSRKLLLSSIYFLVYRHMSI